MISDEAYPSSTAGSRETFSAPTASSSSLYASSEIIFTSRGRRRARRDHDEPSSTHPR